MIHFLQLPRSCGIILVKVLIAIMGNYESLLTDLLKDKNISIVRRKFFNKVSLTDKNSDNISGFKEFVYMKLDNVFIKYSSKETTTTNHTTVRRNCRDK